ncbi:hypothetical protein SLA_4209 [Streptomyces laurentii]|uniref:Uncharacterized protein n=1 Tax=Streptomyces laurentii TaxID=39478 RepID=A0A160P132_STRLU|nr:hypothetical protein SLA_4209 [Streptomyces laurentii]
MVNDDSGFSDAFVLEAERHAAWGAAQLEALTAFLPDAPWTADLAQCCYRQGDLDLRVGLLGSYDSEECTWMWGWANPGLEGTEVVALSGAVERYGRAHGIAELTFPVVDLRGFDDPDRMAEMIAFAGMGVAGAPGYIGAPAGPTTRVYFLPDDTQAPVVPFDPITLPRLLLTGAGLIGRSPRHVVSGHFDHHGLPYREEADRITADLPNGTEAVIEFDALGRITGIKATAGGGGSSEPGRY